MNAMTHDIHADANYRGWGIYLDRSANGWKITAVDRRHPASSAIIAVPGEFPSREAAMAAVRRGIDHTLQAYVENPRVDRSYHRWHEMEADIERYYTKCMESPKARRLGGSRGREYCSRTAWMILRKAGRYRDYPAFRRKAEHSPYVARPSRRRAAEESCCGFENPRDEKQRALLDYRRAYFAPGAGTQAWSERLDRVRAHLDKLGVPMQERNKALWHGPAHENPSLLVNPEETKLSAPAKAALWIGSIATIVGGGALLLGYLWPLPTERLSYKNIIFDVNRSGGTWTSTFSYGNQSFAINGTSRDDVVARTHTQVDALASGT